ncbi:MAG: WXG100 family type VII secretion target [Ardenticatenaceae bacterium]|nr:WXG100 family type VII secretion target [Ardenticatenaceae bacterium]MCB9446606.1 WXG100 family type VII secretion target [Ardenticatenaceae bacterium]
MSILSVLLRFARQVVQNVLSQLMQQFNIVQEQAYKPMQMMVQQVTNGVWVGKGADAFVEEVSSLMMPGVGKIGDGINKFSKNIQNAMDVMDRADEQVSGIINSLGDLFGGIF